MRASVRLQRDDGVVFDAGQGAIIGRLSRADVPVPDPRVSEAHALVSLRGEAFRLLALRGRFVVDGKVSADVVLRPGLRIEVAPDIGLTVDTVTLPDPILGVQADGLPPVPLPGVMALYARPRPEARSGFRRGAAAHLFVDGDGAALVQPGRPVRRLSVGDPFMLDGVGFQLTAVPLRALSAPQTQADGRIDAPLHVVARYDSVHLQRAGHETVVVSGLGARVIGELVALGGTAPWRVVASEVWPGIEPERLRHRLDVTLSRLRQRLSEAGIRTDLVGTDGCGQVELVLTRDDVVVDET